MPFIQRIDSCKQCGGEYLRKGPSDLYCSDKCKEIAKHGAERPCLQCGKGLTKRQTKFCSSECCNQHARDNTERKSNCEHCGKEYLKERPTTRFCSRACDAAAKSGIHEFTCGHCGVKFSKKGTNLRIYKYCSIDCSVRANNAIRKSVRGGQPPELWTRVVQTDGYVTIQTPEGTKREHRYVMEQKLGRALLKGENVHHIDGDRANNAPDNLELWSKAQPSGVRPLQAIESLLSSLSKEELTHLAEQILNQL